MGLREKEDSSKDVSNKPHLSPAYLSSSPSKSETKPTTQTVIKPSPKRYLMVILFCLNAANKGFQWISISANSNKVTYFYGVGNFVINATSVQFLISFIVLSWPACNLIDRWGMRRAILLASFGGAVGGVIKCFCCSGPSGIYLLFIGQAIVSMGEQLVFSVPSRLASVWFPDHQVSSALSASLLGGQLGVALAFVLPKYFLEGCETKEEIGVGLWNFFLANAVYSVLLFFACLVWLEEAPEHPPGEARVKQIQEEQAAAGERKSYMQDMLKIGRQFLELLKNRDFNMLTLSFGINAGLSHTVPTLLNQQIALEFPGDHLIVGRVGFLYILFGALGTPICGLLLDKKHRYLLTNVILTVMTIVSVLAYSYSLATLHSPWAMYVSASLLGIAQTGLLVAGLELAVELTYPAPELATSTLMNFWPMIWGSCFIFANSHIIDTYGSIAGNGFYLVCLMAALLLLFSIRETTKRQAAATQDTTQQDKWQQDTKKAVSPA